MPRGLSLCRRGRGRIDHRPRVGRAGADLRKRQPARRVAALQPRPATHLRGDRPRAPLAGADAPEQLRADGASSSRCAAAISHRSSSRCRTRAARPDAPGARPERFPYVPSNPERRDERCSEVYEIQVQGLATRLRRDGHQARRDRRVGRPRLDPGAAGVRAGDGFARLSAREHSRLHDAGVCDLGAHAGAGAQPDAGHRMHRARNRHPARCACRCSRTSAIRTATTPRSTTSPSRTCRRASAPAICSASPTSTAG